MHPCLWLEGRLRVDPFLHSSSMRPEAACRFARFMAGGQVLRAGDPIAVPDASPSNCCVLCLERGICCPETLRHVVFVCPDYEAIRVGSGLAELLAEQCSDLFLQHRDRWPWKVMRLWRRFIIDLIEHRLSVFGGRERDCYSFMQQRVAELWPFEPESPSDPYSASPLNEYS